MIPRPMIRTDTYLPSILIVSNHFHILLMIIHFPIVFAARLVLFTMESLYIFNILFLILSPIILAGLLFVEAVIKAARKRRQGQQQHHQQSLFTRIFTDFRLMWRWAKFWVAIIVTIGVQALLILIFAKSNPYVRRNYFGGVAFFKLLLRSSTLTHISSSSASRSSAISPSPLPSHLTSRPPNQTMKRKYQLRSRRRLSSSSRTRSPGFFSC